MIRRDTASRRAGGEADWRSSYFCPNIGGDGRRVFFDREDLDHLLGAYSRQVAQGIWRDCAIDHRLNMAISRSSSAARNRRSSP